MKNVRFNNESEIKAVQSALTKAIQHATKLGLQNEKFDMLMALYQVDEFLGYSH